MSQEKKALSKLSLRAGNKLPVIGIIGGNGGMGKQFSRWFNHDGFPVLIASRSTSLSPEDCAKNCDLLIITVPIDQTEKIIQKLGPLVKKDGAIMDFTSLKAFPVKAMEKVCQCEIIGAHPVFGPSIQQMKNQVMVLTPALDAPGPWCEYLQAVFLRWGARVQISSPEKHDQLMAIIQVLVHYTSINFVSTLHALDSDSREINTYSSPVYRARMDFSHRILNQNADLYAEIAMQNPMSVSILERYIEESQSMLDCIKKGDREGFRQRFQEAADYLGEEKAIAEKRSDAIINTMAKFKEK